MGAILSNLSTSFIHVQLTARARVAGKKRNVHLRSGRCTPKKIVSKPVTSSRNPDRWASAFSRGLEAVDGSLRPPRPIPDISGDIPPSTVLIPLRSATGGYGS